MQRQSEGRANCHAGTASQDGCAHDRLSDRGIGWAVNETNHRAAHSHPCHIPERPAISEQRQPALIVLLTCRDRPGHGPVAAMLCCFHCHCHKKSLPSLLATPKNVVILELISVDSCARSAPVMDFQDSLHTPRKLPPLQQP